MSAPLAHADANRAQRAVRGFASSGPGAWVFARTARHLDRALFRATGGRRTLGALITGLPVVMLTTTGARSGLPRTVPLLGLPTPDGLVVIASNFGQRSHPAWYHNLHANPAATVVVEGREEHVRAREAEGDERDRIWGEALGIYPGWSQYERRVPNRRIAVFVLEPVA